MATLTPPSRTLSRAALEHASVASKFCFVCVCVWRGYFKALIAHLQDVFCILVYSYRWVRFEVCRPGDGQVPHTLSEDDASVNFEAFQRQQQGLSANASPERPVSAVSGE